MEQGGLKDIANDAANNLTNNVTAIRQMCQLENGHFSGRLKIDILKHGKQMCCVMN